MPTACINQPDCRVSLVRERLEVRGRRTDDGPGDELLREIPLRDLDRLIMVESTHITSPALAALLRANIPVNLMGWNGSFLGGFLPAQNSHGLARLRQCDRTRDPAFALQMSGRLITAKIYNQRRVLQRLDAGRKRHASSNPLPDGTPAVDLGPELIWLDQVFNQAARAGSIDELRGYEGASTAQYFQAWAGFLPAAFPFERRSTRPPLNPVNACVSFGATLIYNEMVAFIHAHGLDPALGLLHTTENGRWSLALDLIEPFRPVLVEALALDLFSHQVFKADHFESKDGGIYLAEEGRHRFLLQYERRIERQFMSESVGHRTTLRQQLEQQAISYKAALEDPSRFEPFLIN